MVSLLEPGRARRGVRGDWLTAGVVLLSVVSSHAQTLPPRDQTPAALSSRADATGVIQGRILAADTQRPIPRADVRVSSPVLKDPRFLVTDPEGRFSFAELPPGIYRLSAAKTGYVELSYGQRLGWETAAQIDLAAAAEVAVDMTLPRSGVIVVRLIDVDGAPFAGIQTGALFRRFDGGRANYTNAGLQPFAYTDDRGEVRLFGLPPGDYYVSARAGLVTPLQRPRTLGETFYPGTRVLDQAAKVRVAAGAETSVTFVVEEARLTRIAGAIVDSTGAPVTDGTVSLTHYQSSGLGARRVDRMRDGTFSAADLEPGEYLLQVRTGPRPAGTEYAIQPFILDGTNLEGLTIETRPGARIRGRITFDEPAARPQPESVRVRVLAQPIKAPAMSPGVATVHDDWSFEITDVMAIGTLRVESDSGGWRIASVHIDDRDVADMLVDFGARAAFDDVQVRLTRTSAQITGTTVGFKAGDTPRFAVVVFPPDPDLWTPVSQRIALGRLDQAGRFAIAGLPPGEYHVVAVEGLQQGAERNPDTLRELAPRAVRVQLREGGSTSLTLKIGD